MSHSPSPDILPTHRRQETLPTIPVAEGQTKGRAGPTQEATLSRSKGKGHIEKYEWQGCIKIRKNMLGFRTTLHVSQFIP